MIKKRMLLAAIALLFLLSGCPAEADTASYNLSKEADMFRVYRRIVFYNGITDSYIFVIEGFCSLGNADAEGELSVTCKTGEQSYVKHFLGLSDNVTYFSEQIEGANVSPNHHKIIFRPETIVPDIDIE